MRRYTGQYIYFFDKVLFVFFRIKYKQIMWKLNENELCTASKTRSKYIKVKKISSKPSGKGQTSPGENVTGKVSLSKCETPIIFQASVAASQDNLIMAQFLQLQDPVHSNCPSRILYILKKKNLFAWFFAMKIVSPAYVGDT